VIVFFYLFGRSNGIEVERLRVESLCHQAVIKRGSGSVSWIMNAIGSGQRELMPEEKFFGKDGCSVGEDKGDSK
jgi:hypothetical protein